MKFSYKSNPILKLLEEPNWVEKLQYNPMLHLFSKISKENIEAARDSLYTLNAGILVDFLQNVIDLDPSEFKILHFSKNVRERSLSVDASKTLPLFDKSEYKYGCIIFDKHLSVIYGISDRNIAINIALIDGLVQNIEICAFDPDVKKTKIWKRSSSIKTGLKLLQLANKPTELAIVNDALKESNWNDDASYFNDTIPLLALYYFAEIEDKYVQHGKVPRALVAGEKFVNETTVPIQVIGCNWFTNIIRTAGFGVKGHFRNQACGIGLSERKLIWVSDFQKKGYTRVAQKTVVGI